MRLKNKTALISGATGGIGEATSKLFSAEGANVVMVGRDEEKVATGEATRGGVGGFLGQGVRGSANRARNRGEEVGESGSSSGSSGDGERAKSVGGAPKTDGNRKGCERETVQVGGGAKTNGSCEETSDGEEHAVPHLCGRCVGEAVRD